jgi:hypothetical protein
MISLAVDKCNDIFLENGNLCRVTGSAQTIQFVRQRLLTYLGEWFLDTLAGLPYFQQILVKPANEILTEAVIKNEIATTPEVQELTSFEFTFDRSVRIVNIDFTAITEYGEVSASLKMNQTTAEIQSV